MSNKFTFSAVLLQFSMGAAIHTMVLFMLLAEGEINCFYPQILMLYGPLIYGVNRLLLRRERTMASIAVVNVAAVGLLIAGSAVLDGMPSVVGLLFMLIFCGWITVQGVRMADSAPELHILIIMVDICAVLLVMFTAYMAISGASVFYALPIAAGCAAAMLSVIIRRLGGVVGLRGWCIMAVTFTALLVLMMLLVTVAAAPAGEGLVLLWNGLLRVIAVVLNLFLRFLLLFAGDAEGGPIEAEPQPGMEDVLLEEMALEIPAGVWIALGAVALIAVTAAVILLLRILSRVRVGGRGSMSHSAVQRRRVSFGAGFARLLQTLREKLRVKLFLLRHRNTAPALFYGLMHRFRLSTLHKLPEETPGEYLSRLYESAAEDEKLQTALRELQPAVNAALYAPAQPLQTMACAGVIRRHGRAQALRHIRREKN